MTLLAKLKLQYQRASKGRFGKAILGAASGGATAMWLSHVPHPPFPYPTTAKPQDILTAAAASALFAALNFIRDPQFSMAEQLAQAADPTDPPSA